jgi:N-acetylglucosamine kinase-like BadF-type ATPase
MSLSFILYFTYTNTKFSNIPHVPVLNDAHLLGGLLLTHRCPWGVAVIAGTGSIVVGLEVSEEGEVVQYGRRGGVGYLLGDEVSFVFSGRLHLGHPLLFYPIRPSYSPLPYGKGSPLHSNMQGNQLICHT